MSFLAGLPRAWVTIHVPGTHVDGGLATYYAYPSDRLPPPPSDVTTLAFLSHAVRHPEAYMAQHCEWAETDLSAQTVADLLGNEQALPEDFSRFLDVEFLRQRGDELGEAYLRLSFELSEGPIHGDAHPGNLMRDVQGTVVLADLECFAIGPREWDVALAAAYRYGLSWLSDEGYRAFAEVYGYDVAKAPCFPTLRAMREVNMTAWLMQNVEESDAMRAEFQHRMADLRDPDAPRRWQAF